MAQVNFQSQAVKQGICSSRLTQMCCSVGSWGTTMTPPDAESIEQSCERAVARQRVLKACVIAYSGRHITIAAAVRDVSDTGARLRVENALAIPDTFELLLDLDGLEADCEVTWRKDREIGVRFTALRAVEPKRTQVVIQPDAQHQVSLRRKR
jgi:Tfp pilus assembly protein FimT